MRLANLFPVAAVLYVCLGFFEEPLWSRRLVRTASTPTPPDLFHSALYPTFGLPLLSYAAALTLELLCLSLLVLVKMQLSLSSPLARVGTADYILGRRSELRALRRGGPKSALPSTPSTKPPLTPPTRATPPHASPRAYPSARASNV